MAIEDIQAAPWLIWLRPWSLWGLVVLALALGLLAYLVVLRRQNKRLMPRVLSPGIAWRRWPSIGLTAGPAPGSHGTTGVSARS